MSLIKTKIFRKLNQEGFSYHMLVPLFVMVLVGSVGAYLLASSHAASTTSVTVVTPTNRAIVSGYISVGVLVQGPAVTSSTVGTLSIDGVAAPGRVVGTQYGFFYCENCTTAATPNPVFGLDTGEYTPGQHSLVVTANGVSSKAVLFTRNDKVELPKLKQPGFIVPQFSTTPNPTLSVSPISSIAVAYHADLPGFRNPPGAGVHEAVCITPGNQDFNYDGLHLTADAARQLASDITTQATGHTSGYILIQNHDNGQLNPYKSFTLADGLTLATELQAAAAGH